MTTGVDDQPPLGLQELLEQEFAILQGTNPALIPGHDADPLDEIYSRIAAQKHTALCISGGGIRSASFGLGVLQALAKHGLLTKLDYLSTVSGGGYIGSWLTAWIHRHAKGRDGVIQELQAFRGSKIDPESEPIRRLREYSHYLTPQWGLLSADTWTWVAIFLRNLFLNWLVLIPLLAAVLAIPRVCVEFILLNPDQAAANSFPGWQWPFGRFATVLLLGGFVFAVIGIDYVNQNLPITGNNKDQASFIRACLLPFICAAVALSTSWAWFRNSVGSAVEFPSPGAFMFFGAMLHLVGCSAYVFRASRPGSPRRLKELLSPSGILALAAIIFAGAFGGLMVRIAATVEVFSQPKDFVSHYVTFAAPLLLTFFTVATAIYIGLASYVTSDADREWWARAGGWILIGIVGWVVVSWLVLFGPGELAKLEGTAQKTVWGLGGISGLITILVGNNSSTPANKKQGEEGGWRGLIWNHVLTIAAPVFAAFIVIVISLATGWLIGVSGNALSTYLQTANFRLEPAGFWSRLSLGCGLMAAILLQFPLLLLVAVIAGFLLVGLAMGFFVNANKFSLHGAYRDRLIRAYLGASHQDRHPNLFTGFDPSDNMPMSALRAGARTSRFERPFHVINMTLNLVKGGNLAWQERKAESFTATPLHAGSFRVGYRPSDQYGGRPGLDGGAGMSLGTAVAISGAAASPNWGYHSSPLVTFLMALFNVRLGWWLGNPGPAGAHSYRNRGPSFAVRPLIEETFGLTTDTNDYVYLSDGGHFENLGLYEMVLRRCHIIIVSDAGADPKCELEDLGNAIRKIRVDFGIPIEFTEKFEIYRRDTVRGKRWAVASIGYSAVDAGAQDGALIYLKPAFYGDEPVDIVNYGIANREFPHESTLDQWFSESQFESYRMLGVYTVEQALKEMRSKNWSRTPFESWFGDGPPEAEDFL